VKPTEPLNRSYKLTLNSSLAIIVKRWFTVMEQWVQIISTYGVSIAAMIALAVYIVKKDKENQAVINEIMNEHKSEVNDLRKTIENNTLIVTKLYERLSNEK
jgi:hypothetical protein